MAQPLSRQTKTHGTRQTAAKFRPEWKPFELVAPSPKWIECTTSSPRRLEARAAPTPWASWVPMTDDQLG